MRTWLLFAGVLYGSAANAWFADPDRTFGDIGQFVPAVAAAGVALHKDDAEAGGQLLASVVLTAALTEAAKRGFNHTALGRRPDGGPYSFPSGHTSVSCAGAEFLHSRYGWAYAVPAYAVAGFTAWSRIDHRKHHWRDVIAGCAIGFGVTASLTAPFVGAQLSITPLLDPDVRGIQLSVIW